MKITIYDIARITGCSISTVSKALSNSTDINSGTKEQILRCAVDMGYNIGRKKAKSKGTFAAVIQSTEISNIRFEYHMLFGFKLLATRYGYDVEVVQKDPDDASWDFKKEVLDKDFLGIFLLRFGDGDEIFKLLQKSTIPTVIFDEIVERKNAAHIACDNELGIRYGVKHLYDLGHKNIAFYGGGPTAHVSIIRKKSFINSLREFGLTVYPELIAESNFSQDFASKIIPGFLEFGATAIVCASDLLASYAMDELKKHGMSVPQDISLVGFDNVPLAEETTPKLTTIEQNLSDMGKTAFYMLEQISQGVPISQVLFKPQLIVRESTCPPKEKIKV